MSESATRAARSMPRVDRWEDGGHNRTRDNEHGHADTCGAEWSPSARPSVRPTDRRTPSVYLPRNFSRYQVRRGFASPSPGEAASHSGKRELPSLPRSLAPGQSLGAQLKLDESWKLHGLHLINDAARPPQCTRSRQNTHCTVTSGGRGHLPSGVEGIVG